MVQTDEFQNAAFPERTISKCENCYWQHRNWFAYLSFRSAVQCQSMKVFIIYMYITGVEVKFKNLVYPVLIQPTQIREMREIVETQEALKVGASVTLADLEEALRHCVKMKPGNILNLKS